MRDELPRVSALTGSCTSTALPSLSSRPVIRFYAFIHSSQIWFFIPYLQEFIQKGDILVFIFSALNYVQCSIVSGFFFFLNYYLVHLMNLNRWALIFKSRRFLFFEHMRWSYIRVLLRCTLSFFAWLLFEVFHDISNVFGLTGVSL